MKKFQDLIQKRWFANTLAGCITVAVFLLLSNLGTVLDSISNFIGYFSTVIGGVAMAYLMNPLAKLYDTKVFSFIKKRSLRWSVSVGLAVTTVLLFLILILVILIPQLLESITNFVANLGPYASSLLQKLNKFGLTLSDSSKTKLIKNLLASSEDLINKLVDYISSNFPKIIVLSTNAGKGIANWVIAFIISIYLLSAKFKIKKAIRKLMNATMREDVYHNSIVFLSRCNEIMNRYVIFELIDGLIVGVTNAVCMAVFGMEYIGLVSVIVGVTNLVPTFGPIVGGIIGSFILLMVNPVHALIFLIITVVLQTIDGTVIKPKLFGNSFGISGLLILIAIVTGGKIFGILGILLAIPFVAICDYVYKEYLIPRLELNKEKNAAAEKLPDDDDDESPPLKTDKN